MKKRDLLGEVRIDLRDIVEHTSFEVEVVDDHAARERVLRVYGKTSLKVTHKRDPAGAFGMCGSYLGSKARVAELGEGITCPGCLMAMAR